jgi:hypothetical protein
VMVWTDMGSPRWDWVWAAPAQSRAAIAVRVISLWAGNNRPAGRSKQAATQSRHRSHPPL